MIEDPLADEAERQRYKAGYEKMVAVAQAYRLPWLGGERSASS